MFMTTGAASAALTIDLTELDLVLIFLHVRQITNYDPL